MNLCECGCKNPVSKKGNRFLSGHNSKGSKQSIHIIEKRKRTMLERYGVEHSQQSPEIRAKSMETLKNNFGVDHPYQSEDIRLKGVDTCILNHGVSNPSKNKTIQIKKQKTNLKRYGVTSSNQSDLIKDKKRKSYRKKHGVDYWSQTDDGRLFLRNLKIKTLQSQYGEVTAFCGKGEPEFFKTLQSLTDYKILKPKKSMFGYFPDGLIQELKVIIEFDEHHHTYPKQIQHDKKRDSFFKDRGYLTHRIKEYDWVHHKDEVIKEFQLLLGQIS